MFPKNEVCVIYKNWSERANLEFSLQTSSNMKLVCKVVFFYMQWFCLVIVIDWYKFKFSSLIQYPLTPLIFDLKNLHFVTYYLYLQGQKITLESLFNLREHEREILKLKNIDENENLLKRNLEFSLLCKYKRFRIYILEREWNDNKFLSQIVEIAILSKHGISFVIL